MQNTEHSHFHGRIYLATELNCNVFTRIYCDKRCNALDKLDINKSSYFRVKLKGIKFGL